MESLVKSRTKRLISTLIVLIFLSITPGNAYSNTEVAEALAYSGCTYGLLSDPNRFGMRKNVDANLGVGLMYWLDGQGTGLDSWNLTDKGRIGYEHLLESWATAGALNSKWRPLEAFFSKGLAAGEKKWSSGATLGFAKNAANATAGSKLTALCRIAQISIESKAKKSKLTVRQYVIKVSGQYLPQLP
jgi:hypothetical protein